MNGAHAAPGRDPCVAPAPGRPRTLDDPSLEWLALATPPALLGVGSVCRRRVNGSDGILEIVQGLDQALPRHTRLHLFGVKSEALSVLAGHPRIASTDSMAWDFAARCERLTTRSTAFRIECMDRWTQQQRARLCGGPAQLQSAFLFDEPLHSTFEALVLEALALQHADLILSRDVEYLDAVWSTKRDAAVAMAIVRQRGRSESAPNALEELIGGLAERIESLLAGSGAR